MLHDGRWKRAKSFRWILDVSEGEELKTISQEELETVKDIQSWNALQKESLTHTFPAEKQEPVQIDTMAAIEYCLSIKKGEPVTYNNIDELWGHRAKSDAPWDKQTEKDKYFVISLTLESKTK